MKVTRISRFALAAVTGALALAGCGDDGGNNTPDAPHGSDAHGSDGGGSDGGGSDGGGGCTSTALATDTGYEVARSDFSGLTVWDTTVTTDLGDGAAKETLAIELFAGSLDFTAGPIDLSMGDQANYATCEACVLVRETDAQGNGTGRLFFQTGGTLTFSSDPVTGSLAGTATDLTLEEVTIADDGSFMSTAVPGGECLSLGDLTLTAAMTHPYGWTCADNQYNDGATCDCMCGIDDADCDAGTNPVAGCTGETDVCLNAVCTATCDVLGDVGCTASTCVLYNDDNDICIPDNDASIDTAQLGDTCGSGTTYCGVANTIAEGICDNFALNDAVCKQVCDSDNDCGPDEVCHAILTTKGICVVPPAGDTCDTAVALTIGTPVNGTTVGATDNYEMGLEADTCTGYDQAGPDVAYSVDLTAGQAITVALTGLDPNSDLSVSIAGPGTPAVACDAGTVLCDAGSDTAVEGGDETFNYTATTAGTYYVIVDSFYTDEPGPFTLTVTNQ